MGREKNLLSVIESNLNLMRQSLDTTRDLVYDDRYPMSSTVQEIYRQTASNIHKLEDYLKADLIGRINQSETD